MTTGFRRLTVADLRLLQEWLQREHVKRWWREHETYEDVVAGRRLHGRLATHACVADPDAENVASLRASEKAGFAAVRTFLDPADRRLHTLVRAERQGESRSSDQPSPSRS